MIVSLLSNSEDDFDVWIQMEPGNPTKQGESFIIASGKTEGQALSAAAQALFATADDVAAGRGVIRRGPLGHIVTAQVRS